MTGEHDRFQLVRTEFLRIRRGDDTDTNEDAGRFVSQLKSIVRELPARTGTTNKGRRRELDQFAAALARARQYAERMDGLAWLAIDEEAHLATRSDLVEMLHAVAEKVSKSTERLEGFAIGSRSAIATQHVCNVFRMFDLPIRDSANSFITTCIREVLHAMGEDAAGVRGLIRRSLRPKVGQK